MKHMAHLTDDQIDDALIGDLDADCAEHLAGCRECQMRLTEAEAPIAAFNEVTLAWSERHSATLPTRPVQAKGAAWMPKAAWAATAAAVLAVGISVPVARHHRGNDNALTASRESAAGPLMAATGPVDNPVAAREEQIARDNQMLQNIDRELDSPDASPTQMYGVHAVAAGTSTHAPVAVND